MQYIYPNTLGVLICAFAQFYCRFKTVANQLTDWLDSSLNVSLGH